VSEAITKGEIVIYDTEWTSWEGYYESRWTLPGKNREIIQIGGVKLDAEDDFRELAAFQVLIKPQKHPVLSDYIIELTGITQEQVDREGVSFDDALLAFVNFAEGGRLCSFGTDHIAVRENCVLHEKPAPKIFDVEVNLREYLLKRGIIKEDWFSSDLPSRLGLDLQPSAHDALNDARAIASALRYLRGKGNL